MYSLTTLRMRPPLLAALVSLTLASCTAESGRSRVDDDAGADGTEDPNGTLLAATTAVAFQAESMTLQYGSPHGASWTPGGNGPPYKRAQNGFPDPTHARQGLRAMYAINASPEELDDVQLNTRRLHVIPTTNAGRILDGQTRYFGLSVYFDASFPTPNADAWMLPFELKTTIDTHGSPPISVTVENANGVANVLFRFDPVGANRAQQWNVLFGQPLQRGKWLDVVVQVTAGTGSNGRVGGWWYRWVDDTSASKANPPAYTRVTAIDRGESGFSGLQSWTGGTIWTGEGDTGLRMMTGSYCAHPNPGPFIHWVDAMRLGTTFDSVVPAP